jgi:hypothetical protein
LIISLCLQTPGVLPKKESGSGITPEPGRVIRKIALDQNRYAPVIPTFDELNPALTLYLDVPSVNKPPMVKEGSSSVLTYHLGLKLYWAPSTRATPMVVLTTLYLAPGLVVEAIEPDVTDMVAIISVP